MNDIYFKRLLAIVVILTVSACTFHSPKYSSEPRLSDIVQDSSGGQDVVPFADIRVATDDGAAKYRFRFIKPDNGPVVTLIESPLDYPEPDIPAECALSTFLRVADIDAQVPRELLEDCGVPQEDGERYMLSDDNLSLRVSDLRKPEHTLDMSEVPRRKCSKSWFNDRLKKLEELASYQPLIKTNCDSECELFVVWNETGCAFYNGQGELQNNCSESDIQSLILQYGSRGEVCLTWGPLQCDLVPDPECAHTEWVIGDWGPYGNWTRNSAHTSRTTRVRAEITTCCDNINRGWWQIKRPGDVSWGAKHNFNFGGRNTTATLILSAGWDGNNNWNGWDFRIHAEGSCFHAATAWIELKGRNRFRCPLK